MADVLEVDGEVPRAPGGYVDLVGRGEAPSTGVATTLMRSPVVAAVYERWWRPALGRVVKGVDGPSMAQEVGMVRRLVAAGEGDTVVDVACGPGTFVRVLARDVGEHGTVVGVDLSSAMLTRAVRETRAPQVVYVRADAARLRMTEASVDAVCCVAALHLFPDPFAALDRMAGALAPGGRLVVLTTARPGNRPAAVAVDLVARVAGIRVFGACELIEALTARGLEVAGHRTLGLLQLVAARR